MGSAARKPCSKYATTSHSEKSLSQLVLFNRTGVTELNGRTVSYSYDNLYRLTAETISADPAGKNGTVGYQYDPVGNRLSMSSTLAAVPAGTFFYDANDRLTTDVYDANGNTTVNASIGNAYDFENRLVRHGLVTVVYDGDGNRVAETVGGVTTKYLVDTQNPTGYAQVVEELVGSTVQRKYTYGLDLISENQLISGTFKISFHDYDGHGSVRQPLSSYKPTRVSGDKPFDCWCYSPTSA